jgi:hypothetical protein
VMGGANPAPSLLNPQHLEISQLFGKMQPARGSASLTTRGEFMYTNVKKVSLWCCSENIKLIRFTIIISLSVTAYC